MLHPIIHTCGRTKDSQLLPSTGGHTASSRCTIVQVFTVSLLHQVMFSNSVLLHDSFLSWVRSYASQHQVLVRSGQACSVCAYNF